MLDFFRKYQRYFFFVITIVIIISFSFFGTYNTLGSDRWREQIAFTAINGHEVPRMDVDEMAIFIGSDNEDKQYYGGIWGPNFLNDGIIRKDFLETGLAEMLALAYADDLQIEMDKKFKKEKQAKLYTHPQAPFISTENAWSYFSPTMKNYYQELKVGNNALDSKTFQNRVNLYLAEKKFSAATLRQVLKYQQSQYQWLKPDEMLDQTDLSIFGYHNIEDWFSPRFTRLISQFIMNAAILAEAKGYQVSRAEVLADFARQTQISYKENQNNPQIGVANPQQYYNEQLRRMNIDQNRAIKIWRQVLLFRRYFQDVGATALVDNLSHQKFQKFAQESVVVEFYQLPKSLEIRSYEKLQKFQAYLAAISKVNRSKEDGIEEMLALPKAFLTPQEVAKKYPELVRKSYILEVAEANQKTLQARIGLRQMWNWEIEDNHWSDLTNRFPDLALHSLSTKEERLSFLDALDTVTRARIDQVAKQAIIKEHPEWIEQALTDAKPQKLMISVDLENEQSFFKGLDSKDKRKLLIKMLDEASLQEAPIDSLRNYTADQQNYYRIVVSDRDAEEKILTFDEANKAGILDTVLDKVLENYYILVREKQPLLYQQENKEWKPFSSVKELVATQYFEKILLALEDYQKKLYPEQEKKSASKDQLASLRFYPYLKKAEEALKQENDDVIASQWIKDNKQKENLSLEKASAVSDQWKLEKTMKTIKRDHNSIDVNVEEAFRLSPKEWSAIQTTNGLLSFFEVIKKETVEAEAKEVKEQALAMHQLLSNEAKRNLLQQIIAKLKEKNAISFTYLQPVSANVVEDNSIITNKN